VSRHTAVVRGARSLVIVLCLLACGDRQRGGADSISDSAVVAPAAGDSATPAPAPGATGMALPRDSAVDSAGVPRRPTPLPMPQGSTRDTLRGTIAVVGSEPMVQVDLRTDQGRHVHLVGDHQIVLRRLSGAEIWVQGHPTEGMRPGFDVRRFAVRSVDGVRAADGILGSAGGRFHLQTTEGKRVSLEAVPPALRDQIGARIWISGDPPSTIAAYGIIIPR
jgi:hypothetical protein